MAPSPEYDKEPKAPDKTAANISSEDTKLLQSLINDQQHNSDHQTTNLATNSEVENNKHVETLDDDKLRALLNEALTYKCPKDREGKSSLFKELLEEVEQDDQEACEAAARTLTGCRGSRRGARGGRPALPHSNSLQDLVAALAAEPAPRRHHRHHAPAPQPATVAARALHGGSLPSGVDTSSLLSEEVSRGAGYLATVRCVNPPPLAERRVSASDANAPHDLDLLTRRSKPMFPVTYTARATLEIGSGSVCSGRAVTTTTASNQMSDISTPPAEHATDGTDAHALNPLSEQYDIELEEILCHRATKDNRDTGSFSHYLAGQEKLFQVLEATNSKAVEDEYSVNVLENNNNVKSSKRSGDVEPVRKSAQDVSSENDIDTSTNTEIGAITRSEANASALAPRRGAERADRYVLAELPNNAYIFLTLPKRSLTPLAEAQARDLPDKHKRKTDKPPVGTSSCSRKKDTIDKNALRALLFENLVKSDLGSPTPAATEVDSAIPFSCITTPEVVATCNTTPSGAPAAAADPKPEPRPASPPAAARARAPPPDEQPRSVIASSFSGLPLSRPNYGATTSGEDYKKSLDENGNSVQGYSSPLSGSSQHKKPRRKKSSKNETVIDCRQIDGYQGDKDVNELLRFIESNEERAPKLRKHKDDADDKGKKRRKDKEHKPTRAASLEELSRTSLEELTAARAAPERRSWGAAAPDPPDAAPEHNDFQTVTKKRKPRRRTEEAPRRARPPDPRRQDSAPPSDRSNDSNDDLDSVHSLPAPPAHAHPHASYADIARTRHNIPDLIESCNYYAEGEGEPRPADAPPAGDPYPALEAPIEPAARRAPPPRRKERPPPAPAAAECPAPDVVSDRRPPVILLESAARPRDMDGVTFGFDINEQLLGGGARRPRCDLLRDAEEGVPVRAAKRSLRYLPPPPPPPRARAALHHIVEYVAGAWEEAVRCSAGGGGGSEVRYYSE